MKRILTSILVTALLLAITVTSQSNNVPDGFIGLKWGHSLNKMREEMLLYSVKIDDKNPDKVMAIVDLHRLNPFSDLKIRLIGLDFYKDKLYGGIIMVTGHKDWDLLSKAITEKYGKPEPEESG